MKFYEEFLAGIRSAKWEDDDFNIDEIHRVGDEWDRYAFFDMNGDGVPELHTQFRDYYYIFSCIDDEVIVWSILPYDSKLLNNGAILSEYPLGINERKEYAYRVLDYSGSDQLAISFDNYKLENGKTIYRFEGEEISKKQWDTLTAEYFSIGSDQIEWINVEPNAQ